MIKTPSPLERIDEAINRLNIEIGERQAKIAILKKKREILLSLPEICPSCDGTGEEGYVDAAGDSDTRECRTCKGLGKIGPLECKSCGQIIGTDMIALRRQSYPKCPYCGERLMWEA